MRALYLPPDLIFNLNVKDALTKGPSKCPKLLELDLSFSAHITDDGYSLLLFLLFFSSF